MKKNSIIRIAVLGLLPLITMIIYWSSKYSVSNTRQLTSNNEGGMVSNFETEDHYITFEQIAQWEAFDEAMLENVPDYYFDGLEIEFKGPSGIGGRTKAILIDESNPNRIFAGGDTGGMFKSEDGGQHWVVQDDESSDKNVYSIVQNPIDTDILYFSTSNGVYKSNNGGIGFFKLDSYNSNLKKLEHSKINAGTVYGVGKGNLQRSFNSGETWEEIYVPGSVHDIVLLPNGYILSVTTEGLYKAFSENANELDPVETINLTALSTINSAKIRFCKNFPNYIYVLVADYETHYLHFSDDYGATWSEIPVPNVGVNNNSSSLTSLLVHPDNPDYVFFGGVSSAFTLNGGAGWLPSKDGHADHWIAVNNPSDPNQFIMGNDGGLYLHTWPDLTVEPKNLNGMLTTHLYGTTQFYHGDINENGDIIGGLQDNGTWTLPYNGSWEKLTGSDGFGSFFHNQENVIYSSYQNGKIFRIDYDNQTFDPIMDETNPYHNDDFHTKFEVNEADGNQIYYQGGASGLIRSVDAGNSWKEIDGVKVGKAFVISQETHPTLYYYSQGGNYENFELVPNTIRKIENINTEVSDENNVMFGELPFPAGISCLAINPTNSDELIVATHLDGNQGYSRIWLFKSFNNGDYQEFGVGIPEDLGVNTIAYNPSLPHHILAGTNYGVYETMYGSGKWTKITDVPSVKVSEIKANNDGTFAIFTYGRGVWTLERNYLDEDEFANLPYVQNFENSLFTNPNWRAVSSTGHDYQIMSTSYNGYDDYCSEGKLVMDCGSFDSDNSADLRLNLKYNLSDINMSFVRKSDAQGDILISNDGGLSFVKIYDLEPSVNFKIHSIDISLEAAVRGIILNEWSVIRFTENQELGDIALIDNLVIAKSAKLPFSDRFSKSRLSKYWSTYSTGDGIIKIEGVSEESGLFKFASGRMEMYGGPMQSGNDRNEARLYLDTYNNSNLKLSFDWQSLGNVHHSYNGVYISTDGAEFTKVLDLNTEEHFIVNHATIDLSGAIESFGLCNTGALIVEFQHYGKYGPPLTGGLSFDNIMIGESEFTGTYTTMPVDEQFESNLYTSHWELTPYSHPISQSSQVITTANYVDHCKEGKLLMRRAISSVAPALNYAMVGIDMSEIDESKPVTLSFASMEFDELENVENEASLRGVFLSDDGGVNFVKVSEIPNTDSYEYTEIDLSTIASINFTSTMVVKFQEYQSRGNGLLIDNLVVTNQESASVPFLDGFSSFNLGGHWSMKSVGGGIINPTFYHTPQDGVLHLYMNTSDQYIKNTNMAQLHIDLSQTENVKLSFGWKALGNGNVSNNKNGVYISDDGGNTYHKIHDLNTVQNNYYIDVELNLTELINSLGLCSTKNFVIKFQQFKPLGYYNNGGMTFDNIAVEEITDQLQARSSVTKVGKQVYNLTNADYLIYPNPLNDNSDLSIKVQKGVKTILLYGINGNILGEWEITSQSTISIPSDHFTNSGLYLVKLIPENSSDKVIVEKIIMH